MKKNIKKETQKEIETIKREKITVNCRMQIVTDWREVWEHGLTIGELIENFVGDWWAVLTQTEVMKEIMLTSGSSVVGSECSQSLHC